MMMVLLQLLRVKMKQYDSNYGTQNTEIKYRNYWADHIIMQRERQSVIYKKVSEGIIDK